MIKKQRLTDAEFEVMQAIWNSVPPVTSTMLLSSSPDGKSWKAQTVLTLLSRMEKKGFVISEKQGRERYYSPLVSRDDYMAFEASELALRYKKNSFAALVGSLYQGDRLQASDLDELEQWLQEQRHDIHQ